MAKLFAGNVKNISNISIERPNTPNWIVFEEITPIERKNTIFELRKNNAIGRDNLKIGDVKFVSSNISDPVTYILNKVVKEGVLKKRNNCEIKLPSDFLCESLVKNI